MSDIVVEAKKNTLSLDMRNHMKAVGIVRAQSRAAAEECRRLKELRSKSTGDKHSSLQEQVHLASRDARFCHLAAGIVRGRTLAQVENKIHLSPGEEDTRWTLASRVFGEVPECIGVTTKQIELWFRGKWQREVPAWETEASSPIISA